MIKGADVQTEVALMRRLQRIGALPPRSLALAYQPDQCDLLVIQDGAGARSGGAGLDQEAAGRPLWLIDTGGRLSDPAHGPAPLGEAAIRQVLQALLPAQADPPVPADADQAPLAQQLRQRLAGRSGRAVLSLDGVPVLLLDFAAGTARALHSARQADNLPGLLGPGFERLVLQPVSAAQARAEDDAPPLPLTPLLWQTALRMRMVPRLLAPMTESTALRMTQWPDFRVLAHRHDDFRLCSLLLKQASTATAAADLLEIDPGAARAFFNAAYLSGHASPEDISLLPPPATAPEGPRSRLARLWRSMRGGGRRQDHD